MSELLYLIGGILIGAAVIWIRGGTLRESLAAARTRIASLEQQHAESALKIDAIGTQLIAANQVASRHAALCSVRAQCAARGNADEPR